MESPSTPRELRQIAGLTAGHVSPLGPGIHHIVDPEGHGASFAIHIEENGAVVVSPEDGLVTIDGEPLRAPRIVHHQAIDVGNALYVVRQASTGRDRRGDNHHSVAWRAREETAAIPEPVIGVAALLEQPSEATPARPRRRLGRRQDDVEPPEAELIRELLRVRSSLAVSRRRRQPDPAQLLDWAITGDDKLWNVAPDHRYFARVPLAYGIDEWTPRFDNPDAIPASAAELIQQVSHLPSVPIMVDLRSGPLAIVGPRPALLACARHLVTNLTIASSPEDLDVAVITAQDHVDDWQWSTVSPHITIGPSTFTDSTVAIVDGANVLSWPPLATALNSDSLLSTVLLVESPDDVLINCTSMFVVDSHGRARLTDFRFDTIDEATAIGVSAELAAAASSVLSTATRSTTTK